MQRDSCKLDGNTMLLLFFSTGVVAVLVVFVVVFYSSLTGMVYVVTVKANRESYAIVHRDRDGNRDGAIERER